MTTLDTFLMQRASEHYGNEYGNAIIRCTGFFLDGSANRGVVGGLVPNDVNENSPVVVVDFRRQFV